MKRKSKLTRQQCEWVDFVATLGEWSATIAFRMSDASAFSVIAGARNIIPTRIS